MAPWTGPRHRSWASNANLAALSCLVVLVVYVIMWFASPKHDVPVEIKTLVGLAGGAWFQGITTDKRKRERDVQATATRAEDKADDALSQSASSLRRERDVQETATRAEGKADDALSQSASSLGRESGWSQHRDHIHVEDEGDG